MSDFAERPLSRWRERPSPGVTHWIHELWAAGEPIRGGLASAGVGASQASDPTCVKSDLHQQHGYGGDAHDVRFFDALRIDS